MGATHDSASRSVDRLVALGRDHEDERPLRIALIEEIRRLVSFDAYAWLLTDPETEVGSAPLADVPALPDLPRLIRAKYLTTDNRWNTLDGTEATLREATAGASGVSGAWRDVLSTLGVDDVASLVFRDQYGCWGWLDLWRMGDARPFSAGEKAVLAAIATPVTAILRRCQGRTFEKPTSLPERSGPVVLVLSSHLEVRAQTPDTERYLRALIPPDGDGRPIPAGAYNVAAQLLAVEAGVDHHQPSARVHLTGGGWMTLRAARVRAPRPTDEEDIAVTIEPTSPAERLTLFARSHALSPRETELLERLAQGVDTRTLAQDLFVSEHTVQDHLKAIFAKTGARNRRTLLSRVSGR